MKEPHLNKAKHKRHRGWNRLRKHQNDAATTQSSMEVIHSLAHAQIKSAGIIRPDTGELHMPSGLAETGDGQRTNAPPVVMLVIITLALIFLAFITYLVSQMPKKD